MKTLLYIKSRNNCEDYINISEMEEELQEIVFNVVDRVNSHSYNEKKEIKTV